MNRSATAVRTLILLLLGSTALYHVFTVIVRTAGIDFYNFWGVPVAKRLAGHTLGSPYRDGHRYVETLKAYAASGSDAWLRRATSFRSDPEFWGSPFLYTVFTWVPSDYTLAVTAFRLLQLVLFFVGLWLLGRRYRLKPFALGCLALTCVLIYRPLLSDLVVGNLGAVQFFCLAGLLGLGELVIRAPAPRARTVLGAVYLAALAALTLAKPNVVLIGVLLTAHVALRLGARPFALAAAPAAVATAVVVLLPCLYFGEWAVWREWYALVYGGNPYMMVLSFASGNFSTALLLSTWLGRDVFRISLVLLAAMTLTFVAAAAWPRARRGGRPGVKAVATRLLGDASMALGIGIVLIAATSPLFWLHYYVLLLIPALWLLAATPRSLAASGLAAAAMVMNSGVLELRPLGWTHVSPTIIALSWVPLWLALLLRLGASVDADTTPVRAGQAKTASGRVGRRHRH